MPSDTSNRFWLVTRGTWERWAALSGLVAVALWVIGVVIDESSNLPGEDPNEILSWFQDESNTILVGASSSCSAASSS
jgi:hypothetical protein